MKTTVEEKIKEILGKASAGNWMKTPDGKEIWVNNTLQYSHQLLTKEITDYISSLIDEIIPEKIKGRASDTELNITRIQGFNLAIDEMKERKQKIFGGGGK